MGYTVRITKRQLRYFSKLAKTEGKVLIKHLPDSSDFSSKEGSWKNYWLSLMKKSWPKVGAGKEEQVGCHVVDIKTGCVYICPRSGNENTTIIGHEDERIFIVNRNLLVPFRLEDSNYEGPCKSPQESLSKALSKISLL